MAEEQLSFFHPTSTETGQTAWSKEEGDKRLAVIRAKQRQRMVERFHAIFEDRRPDG